MVNVKYTLAVAASRLVSLAAAAATSGDFDILSINVAGLPAIFNSNDVPGDKATNARTIGSYLAKYDYDIVHMQEDFNYHAYIYETDDHPYRTATSGPAAFGSGLNSVSNFPWINDARVKWNTCSDASGSDCLTPKGFTFMRVQVSEGVYIDAYNLHADAGSLVADKAARAANLKQVADYINIWSVGNAVLVYGDTNSRYTRVEDGITIFRTQNSMTDVWVELIRGGVEPTEGTTCTNPSTTNFCEIVDKAFYRGSKQLTLQATQFNYDSSKFLQPDGNILSDHNILRANFTWSVSNSLRQSDFFGGPHGTWFNNIVSIPAAPKVSVLTFRSGERVDAVGLTLRSGQTFMHGGTGGSVITLTLGTTEYWTKATLCQGKINGRTRIFYLQATTSTGRTLTAGRTTGECKTSQPPSGWAIVGYLGQSGDAVDQLGFIYAPQ